MIERYELNAICPLWQLHDEEIMDIVIKDNSLIMTFETLIHPRDIHKSCTLIFEGFRDMIYDVLFIVAQIDSELNISGKEYYLQEFIEFTRELSRPLMAVNRIMSGYEVVVIHGCLLGNHYPIPCSVVVNAKVMYYDWK